MEDLSFRRYLSYQIWSHESTTVLLKDTVRPNFPKHSRYINSSWSSVNVVEDMWAEISTFEVHGNARFALCSYESTFRPTNGKTESIYMQRDWVRVNVFISEVFFFKENRNAKTWIWEDADIFIPRNVRIGMRKWKRKKKPHWINLFVSFAEDLEFETREKYGVNFFFNSAHFIQLAYKANLACMNTIQAQPYITSSFSSKLFW